MTMGSRLRHQSETGISRIPLIMPGHRRPWPCPRGPHPSPENLIPTIADDSGSRTTPDASRSQGPDGPRGLHPYTYTVRYRRRRRDRSLLLDPIGLSSNRQGPLRHTQAFTESSRSLHRFANSVPGNRLWVNVYTPSPSNPSYFGIPISPTGRSLPPHRGRRRRRQSLLTCGTSPTHPMWSPIGLKSRRRRRRPSTRVLRDRRRRGRSTDRVTIDSVIPRAVFDRQ